MNRYRRKELRSIIDQLEELRDALETLKEEEEEYMENIGYPATHSGLLRDNPRYVNPGRCPVQNLI